MKESRTITAYWLAIAVATARCDMPSVYPFFFAVRTILCRVPRIPMCKIILEFPFRRSRPPSLAARNSYPKAYI